MTGTLCSLAFSPVFPLQLGKKFKTRVWKYMHSTETPSFSFETFLVEHLEPRLFSSSCNLSFYGDLVSMFMWIRHWDRKIVSCFHCIHRMAHKTNKYIVCMILALFVWNWIWNERNISTPLYSDMAFQFHNNCVLIFETFLVERIETRSFITRFNLAFMLKTEHFCSI